MSITDGLKREISRARAINKFILIAQIADEIAIQRQHETDLMLHLVDGTIRNEAKMYVKELRRKGLVDKMYMPTGK